MPTPNTSRPDATTPTAPSAPDAGPAPIHVGATLANKVLPMPPTHIQLAAAGDWVPSSCTLPTAEQPLRQAEFDDLFSTAVQSIDRPTPTTLDLKIPATAEATARELAAREVGCCNFFIFDFHPCTNDTRITDTRASDTRASDTRTTDTRTTDTRTTDTRASDTRTLRIGVPDSPTYLAVLDALEARARRQLRKPQ